MVEERGKRKEEGEATLSSLPFSLSSVKLVAFDLDGTLLTSDKRITERSVQVIKQLSNLGIIMLPCTGRPPRQVKGYLEQLGLSSAIVFNGAAIYNLYTDSTIYRHCFEKATALEVIHVMRERVPNVLAGMETSHGWYLDIGYYEWRKMQPQLAQLEPHGVGDLCDFVEEGTVKIYFRKSGFTAKDMSLALEGLEVYRTWSSEELLEVMPALVNKREALVHACTELGISWQEVITFGDEHNDQGMLLWAGLGIAMGNAKSEAKDVAKFITKSNDEDGVAVVLEQVLANLAQGSVEQ